MEKLATPGGTFYTCAMLTYTITETDHCRRIESFLQNRLPAAPLSYLRKITKSGSVTLNGETLASSDAVLRQGDVIALKESSRLVTLATGKPAALDVLFEDQWIIVFNKEPGLAVHRAAEVDHHNLVELGQAFLRNRDGIPPGSPLKLRPVNRLDRGTSGAIVLAKSPTAAGVFGRMVKEEGLGKLYLALVQGIPPAEGEISAPLEGKESRTDYRVLLQGNKSAFVAVTPVTGRMHQIRQHFQLAGHPIVGDKRYGGKLEPAFAGHALHSFRTSFTHPFSGVAEQIYAPLSTAFLHLVHQRTGYSHSAILQSVTDLLRG